MKFLGDYLSINDERLILIPDEYKVNECGVNVYVAVLYFFIFLVLCAFILLNLVIAIILDSYNTSSKNELLKINSTQLREYQIEWSELDSNATSFVSASHLTTLILRLTYPMGTRDEIDKPFKKTQELLIKLQMPIHHNKIHFLETLYALSKKASDISVPEEYSIKIQELLQSRLFLIL